MTKNELLDTTITAGSDGDAMLRYEKVAFILANESSHWRIMAILNQIHRNGEREAVESLVIRTAARVDDLNVLDALAKDV